MPFCNKCGTEVPENVNFCQKCGNALQSGQEPSQSSDEAKKGIFRRIIEGCALLLCVLFFVCPLVKCSGGNVAYSGWEMAAGSGVVKGEPFVFVLIIIPIALLILALIGKSFIFLRNVSIVGLVAKIGFLIVAYMNIKKIGFELTGANWFILGIYIGLVCFTQYCVNFVGEAHKQLRGSAKKNLKSDHNEEHKQSSGSLTDARNWKTYITLPTIMFGVLIVGVLMQVFIIVSRSASTEVIKGKGSFVDSRDGKSYKTVRFGDDGRSTIKIADVIWMAENLNYNAEGSKCYENKEENCQKYGRLYDWETAKSACPPGWSLPSKDGWQRLVDFVGRDKRLQRLVDFLGGVGVAGNKLKASNGWDGIDAIGFSALPGGARCYGNSGNEFGNVGNYGFWWTSTSSEDSESFAYSLFMGSKLKDVNIGTWGKGSLYSVRCYRPGWLDKY